MSARIVHVITRLEAGGAPRSLLLLLEGLRERGFEIELAAGPTPPGSEHLDREVEGLGIRFHRLSALSRDPHPIRDVHALGQLMRLFRTRRPDLAHLHTSKAGFLGRLAALFTAVPFRVYSPRGTILEGYFGGRRTRLFAALDRLAARWCDAIIGLTLEESQSYLDAEIGRPQQHRVIPIGIDPGPFRPPAPGERSARRREMGLGEQEVVLATAGRLVPVKDHATLLRGLAQLGGGLPPWRMWIFGGGPEETPLRELASSLGIDERCYFHGQVEDLTERLPLADVFVLTSVNEGFGRVILEAMAGGVAVVATRVGGIPSVIEEGRSGLLVPPRDPTALAETLRRVLRSEPLRRRLSEGGTRRVREKFTLGQSLQSHVDLYEELLNSGRGRSR